MKTQYPCKRAVPEAAKNQNREQHYAWRVSSRRKKSSWYRWGGVVLPIFMIPLSENLRSDCCNRSERNRDSDSTDDEKNYGKLQSISSINTNTSVCCCPWLHQQLKGCCTVLERANSWNSIWFPWNADSLVKHVVSLTWETSSQLYLEHFDAYFGLYLYISNLEYIESSEILMFFGSILSQF